MAEHSKNKYPVSLISIIIGVIILWIVSGFIIYLIGKDWGERGTIGDMFGAINALFSGLAFAGVLYAIFLQSEDLKIHKTELELNRKELRASANAQNQAQKALREQVTQMQLTAKLNAMNTIINYYNIQISNSNNPQEIIDKAKQKRRDLIKKFDILIDDLEDTDIE